MAATRVIPRAEWKTFFDHYTRRFLSPLGDAEETALIEVISPSLGAELEASVVPLIGLDYDPRSNAFELVLADIDHFMFYPTEIAVIEEDDGFISALEVTRVDATQEIVQIRRSPALAPTYLAP
jgi:Family of unknown function (DUF5335)